MDKPNRKRLHVSVEEQEEEENNNSIEDSEWSFDLEESSSSSSAIVTGNGTTNNEKMATLQAQVKMLEAQLKCAKMESKVKDSSMVKKLDEISKRMTSMEERHRNEIASLKAKKHKASDCEEKPKQMKRKAQFANIKQEKTIQKNQHKAKEIIRNIKMNLVKDNPHGNHWNLCHTGNGEFWTDGLNIRARIEDQFIYDVFAEQGFDISADSEHGGKNNSAGSIILYYYEVKQTSLSESSFYVGLSNGYIRDKLCVGHSPNTYSICEATDYCWRSGKKHYFDEVEWPNGDVEPEWNGQGDVIGCGLLNRGNKLAIFFTLDGILLGQPTPIKHPAKDACLYPTLGITENVSLEANFGDDPTKPFKYDVNKCPGLEFE